MNVNDLKTADPEIICQGAIFEYVSTTLNTFSIPSTVFADFNLPIVSRNFNYSAMLYPIPNSVIQVDLNNNGIIEDNEIEYPDYQIYGRNMREDERKTIPDITQLETKLWIYYMAKRFLLSGCEAIHFGQASIMNLRDYGNSSWWSILSLIRLSASTLNRGVVICDAHVGSSGGLYYDIDPNNLLPVYDRKLLFDFHSGPIGLNEFGNCINGNLPAIIDPNAVGTFYKQSKGGKNPQGWTTIANPYLVEFDNFGISNSIGCVASSPNQSTFTYGFDDISWFANNNENDRNNFLKYAYYKVRCIDNNCRLAMPGRRNINLQIGLPESLYRCNTSIYNQEKTIKDIWSESYNIGKNWIHEIFTDDEVLNPPIPPHVKNSLIKAGDNMLFYIGQDSRIHGYVKYNNSWVTVSPSWSAHVNHNQNINNQVLAIDYLTASPDGTKLLYKGNDGFIYGFIINSIWDYSYFQIPNTQMLQQGVTVSSDIIFLNPNTFYYIAKEKSGRIINKRVHGFVYYNNQWLTVSPSWSANENGFPIFTQTDADGSLVLNYSKTKLYYRGVDGFIYYFSIINEWTYTYGEVPQTQQLSQNIRVSGNIVFSGDDKFFYIGNELQNNSKRIHGFVYYNNQWITVSPSWSANSLGYSINNQTEALSNLCISPNTSIISYIGSDMQNLFS